MTDNSKLGNLTRMLKDDWEKEQAGTSISSWRPSWWLIQTNAEASKSLPQTRNSFHFKNKSYSNPATKQQDTWDPMAT